MKEGFWLQEGVDSKGTKTKQPSNQAHDTYQMRLKIPNDMGYKKALCNGEGTTIFSCFRCSVMSAKFASVFTLIYRLVSYQIPIFIAQIVKYNFGRTCNKNGKGNTKRVR